MTEKMNLNLLPSRAKFRMAKMAARKMVRKILTGFLIGWVVLASLLLAVWFLSDLQLKATDKKYKSAVSEYSSLGDSAITSLQLKYRAKIVGQLLKSRFEYGETLEKLKKFFPPEVEMSNFELEPQSFFTLSGKCRSNGCMTEVEKRIKDINLAGSPDFNNVRLISLKWNDGVWEFAAEVGIK